jgi:hypothetical protein
MGLHKRMSAATKKKREKQKRKLKAVGYRIAPKPKKKQSLIDENEKLAAKLAANRERRDFLRSVRSFHG